MDKHYQTMWLRSMAEYQGQHFQLDKQIANTADSRRGITLLARLSQPVKDKTTAFLTELHEICPEQYCYPQSDMHITIMSIVSCCVGYKYQQESADQYLNVLKNLTSTSSFRVNFSGITLSSAAILLAGYTDQQHLANLRSNVRNEIACSGLTHSMDSRYRIETAHSTIFRYQTQPKNSHKLIHFLQENQNRQFGNMEVKSLELVFNDWYQTNKNTRLIGNIPLIK